MKQEKMGLKQGLGLDFQASDEAWYDVCLVVPGEMMIMKYREFSDETYSSTSDFKDLKELEDFQNKFRPNSVQLQDSECKKVVEGMTLCASFPFSPNMVKFYDAVVDKVDIKDHRFEEGEEVCTCKFLLFWLYGPNVDTKTWAKVENICLLQPENAQMDPTLALFLKMSREKLDCDSRARSTKERKSSMQSVSTARKSKGGSTDQWERTGQDRDLGGKSNLTEDLRKVSNFHYMVIDNLEKDLPPTAIVDFVNNHVSISCQAQLLPSLSLESYIRGAIVADSPEEIQKLADFLLDPAHMVLSSRGRPWVITEKKLRCGAVGAPVRNLATLSESRPWDKNVESGEKIKIVTRGTEEYKRGMHLRESFLKHADDQRSLHRLYVLEEGTILWPPNDPGKQL